ncbi:MAG: Trm112 family protein [Acidimicrobiaceae bacterium]|nr:Trm112 family protein [Acidimicrobiaceae bacterium]
MPLDPFLLTLLQDPVDHGELLYIGEQDVLYNPRLRVVYEVRDSIAVLLPDESRAVSDQEHEAWSTDSKAIRTGR